LKMAKSPKKSTTSGKTDIGSALLTRSCFLFSNLHQNLYILTDFHIKGNNLLPLVL
jgi:hypothetical protein